ncbi:uncharacterized protein LOC113147328 [Cyclospora cayetanensis]|uniref:Uncharacterized protein LOC113147328 n=1 Tax=Cyclospora cayetanensis TaxID=88456 RepID=A0A6P6RZL9_9EIME|nr:uncharacterized protein LOC113147328 [Cyclospora cayetanensis]
MDHSLPAAADWRAATNTAYPDVELPRHLGEEEQEETPGVVWSERLRHKLRDIDSSLAVATNKPEKDMAIEIRGSRTVRVACSSREAWSLWIKGLLLLHDKALRGRCANPTGDLIALEWQLAQKDAHVPTALPDLISLPV